MDEDQRDETPTYAEFPRTKVISIDWARGIVTTDDPEYPVMEMVIAPLTSDG